MRKTIKIEELERWIQQQITETNARLEENLKRRNQLMILDLESYLRALADIDVFVQKAKQ
jgi:hypothetical protein